MMEFPQILFVVCPLVFLGGLIDALGRGAGSGGGDALRRQ